MAVRRSLTRRDVLRYGVSGGAALATGAGGALLTAGVGGASALAKGGKPPKPHPHEFEEATITDLQEAMSSGQLSAKELTRWYLTRIHRLNGQSPGRPTDQKLHAVIETNPDAMAVAARLDIERRVGRTRGPLHGIPVIVKDNIATDDRMETTAGSLALVGSKVPRDAPLVARLRAAGPSSSARPTSRSGRTSGVSHPSTAGAPAAASLETPMCSTSIPVVRRPDRRRRLPPTCAPSRSAPRPTDRSRVQRASSAWWASNRPSASSRRAASSRSRPVRTPPDQ